METVCIKLDKGLAHEVDRVLKKHHYSSKTEFVREAIRDKISEIEKKEALARLEKFYGSSKRKTTDAQLREAREKAVAEIERRFSL